MNEDSARSSPESNRFRLCLVDGTFELFRAFYGAPSRVSASGREVGATQSLSRSLSALVQSREFSHFAVAFDTVIESFRNDLFAGYKTGEGIDPLLFAQFPLAERAARTLGFAVLSMVEFEADDGLATLAWEHGQREDLEEIVIASPDKDLRQCVADGDDGSSNPLARSCPVVTWDRIRKIRYDERAVFDKMGIRPQSVPDFLALVGDTADGIPGVPRWGARSAAQVLARYEHLENIPRDQSKWEVKVRGAKALVDQLCEHEEEVALYRRLATLRSDVPHGLSFEELRHPGDIEARLEQVDALLEERDAQS